MGVKYYGRNRVYDGPPLTKLIDFVDACKVPIITLAFILVSGFAIGSLSMLGIGTLGLFLFALVYLLVFMFRPPS
jgi:hypothetical protein